MSLRKRWRDLDRSTVANVPDAPGIYELVDGTGDSIGMAAGILRDELKEALAYGEAEKVRWEVAQSREHAERLLDEHTRD